DLERFAADSDAFGFQFAQVRTAGGTFAKDLGRDALADFALGVAVLEERPIGMGMHVDKARGDDEAADVDLLPSETRFHMADRGDTIALDRNVAPMPRVAGPVDNFAVAQ